MPKIFVPNKSIHDFSSAEEFGDIIFLSEGNLNRYNTSKIYRLFYPIMKNSTPDDYLLVTGLPMANLVAAFILIKKHKRLNLLLFKSSKNKKEYLERILI